MNLELENNKCQINIQSQEYNNINIFKTIFKYNIIKHNDIINENKEIKLIKKIIKLLFTKSSETQ